MSKGKNPRQNQKLRRIIGCHGSSDFPLPHSTPRLNESSRIDSPSSEGIEMNRGAKQGL